MVGGYIIIDLSNFPYNEDDVIIPKELFDKFKYAYDNNKMIILTIKDVQGTRDMIKSSPCFLSKYADTSRELYNANYLSGSSAVYYVSVQKNIDGYIIRYGEE